MKFISKIATTVGLTLVLATVSFAQHVKTDYDHNANFGQYKTYSWEKVQTKDPLLVDRIKAAVNSTLAAKGWTEVPSGGDVEVFAVETTRNQQALDTFYNGFGRGRRRSPLGIRRLIWKFNYDRRNLQGRYFSGRSVRCKNGEIDLAKLIKR